MFLRESGYAELSVAIWQANLDINFRSPSFYKDFKTGFQEYWESEVSRLGEADSLGWDHFDRNKNNAEGAAVQTDKHIDFIAGDALFQNWANAERMRQKASHIPAKTSRLSASYIYNTYSPAFRGVHLELWLTSSVSG